MTSEVDELAELAALDSELEELEYLEARDSLAVYAGLQIPQDVENDDLPALSQLPMAARYVPALHHRLIVEKLEAIERGYVVERGKQVPFKRLMILAPPGSAKSTYASTLFPAWYHGKHPRHDIIGASQTQELADRFGRRTRNTVGSAVHRAVFNSGLARDQRAAGQWMTEQGGEYFATGVQPFAGRRADGVITDDLIRGRQDADSKVKRESTWQWIIGDLRPRMKPDAWWVFITTRWHEDDPAGRILPEKWDGKSGWVTARDGEQWYVLCLVAVIETAEERRYDPLKRRMGEIIWPEWFTVKMLSQERRSQGTRNWNALYQQKPKPDEGAIIKKAWWRLWPHQQPPRCEFVVSVYDTAFEEGQENDFTARTSWGIFWFEETPESRKDLPPTPKWSKPPTGGRYCAILLERFKDKVEFPELRKLADAHYREFKPDRVLVEKKASGHSLIHELRRNKVPVIALPADISKLARTHAATPAFEDGCIFYMERTWAHDVIDNCATFPNGTNDDLHDTVVHAVLFLRRTFHLQTKGDVQDDDENESITPQHTIGHRVFA